MDVELRNCPLCNTPPSCTDVIGPLVANHHKLEGGEFSLTYCACGELIYLSPAPGPSDIRAMYAESRQFDEDEVYRGERAGAVEDFYSGCLRRLLAKMNKQESDAIRILEIGAGLSWMCRAAKNVNPKSVTTAQDISSEAVRECTWVDRYYVGDIMDCREIAARAPYDLVSLTHVIEHLLDPVSVLKRIRELISPAGLVFITAPHRPPGWKRGDDIGKWREWSYNHVPGHLQYFSRGSLERAARGAGFEVALWDGEQEEGQAFEAWLQPSEPVVSMISTSAREQVSRYRSEFANARAFRHVVIDDFFEADKAEKLLADFPPFDPANARNEFGEVGRKATIPDIRKISPFYADVYRYIASRDFLDFVSQVTAIPDLVHDELMYGGGTHENLEGQELDPHVDFNFLEDRKLHRRLNLLLYLNKEWEGSWGGCLELHSNPRRPKENRVKVVAPLFNRCVIFETTEHSWHGFERIRLPEDKKHLSRKLLSIYLYTRDRPAEEIVPPHGTFYVQRPMPAHVVAGHTLAEEDVRQIEELFTRRDGWIEYYHKKEIADSRRVQDLTTYLESLKGALRHLESVERAVRVPLTGYALQEGPAQGFWPDGWIGNPFEVAIRLQEPMDAIVVQAYLPENFPPDLELCLWVNGAVATRQRAQPGVFTLETGARIRSGELVKLGITSNRSYCPVRAGTSSDERELVVVLGEIRVLHAGHPQKMKDQRPGLWTRARNRFWKSGS